MVDDQDSIEDNDIDTGPWQQSEQLSPQSCENSTHTSQCNSGSNLLEIVSHLIVTPVEILGGERCSNLKLNHFLFMYTN